MTSNSDHIRNNNIKILDTEKKVVIQFCNEHIKKEIWKLKLNFENMGLQTYLPDNITITKTGIQYDYVEGKILRKCKSLTKPKWLYVKMCFELFRKNILLYDLSQKNIIYSKETDSIKFIDLEGIYCKNRICFVLIFVISFLDFCESGKIIQTISDWCRKKDYLIKTPNLYI